MIKTEEIILKLSRESESLLGMMKELNSMEHSSFLEERTEVLRTINDFLRDAYQILKETDRRIEETVSHESVIWPKTEFGISRFEQLNEMKHLIHPEYQKIEEKSS